MEIFNTEFGAAARAGGQSQLAAIAGVENRTSLHLASTDLWSDFVDLCTVGGLDRYESCCLYGPRLQPYRHGHPRICHAPSHCYG